MRRVAVIVALAGACTHKDPVAELQDPSTCMQCHPKHYDQWSGSMHAYASDDPVFVAMHKRGQRDTGGALGTFCLQCHAPMAVALGIIDDHNAASFDPAALPPSSRGITCYFCHDAVKVIADHNNGVQIALDQTMRGGAANPADTPAHASLFDTKLLAGPNNDSSLCGSCHDVTTPSPPAPAAVALERTFSEWKTSIFALDDPRHHESCANCHMVSSYDVIAQGPGLNVGLRPNGFHDHFFPAIDQALTPWPQTDAMTMEVASILDPAVNITGPTPPAGPVFIGGGVCVTPLNGGEITVRMDAQSVGHKWPSGAAQDRRAWLEVIAYAADNTILFASGVVPADKDPDDIPDPMLFGLWDRIYKSDTTPAHFFWEVATEDSQFLKAPTTLVTTDPAFDHSTTKHFAIGALQSQIDHITARIVIRPLNFALLDDLIASGDLDPGVKTQLKTLVTGAGGAPFRTWTRATFDPLSGCCPAGSVSC